MHWQLFITETCYSSKGLFQLHYMHSHVAGARGLSSFPADPPSQLDVLGHDGDPLGMDGAEVSVFKESHKVGLACLLKSHHSRALERQLADQQLCGLLVPPDLPECNCARPVAVRLLHTPSCRSRLASSLGCQLLPGSLSSS